ncbi:hypothetical protein NX784_13210 [Massilia pinisoli]|uniref:Uncharacterized protein n=1 Tax=Massilia pinisoli TaxID=1772194 RepID=A0ABT1ZRK7_9BURK|nr:hypothetical protein [Massilia pinisoli]MCS0582553.1 hypothetical protein [Massilia pinisoli]
MNDDFIGIYDAALTPAQCAHTYKGDVAASGDKYVATSWILYRRAEELFAPPTT